MAHERKDFEALVEKGRKSLNGERPGLEYLVQAQVKMGLLTGNAHWDTYLTYLQSTLERISLQADEIRERLCDPRVVDSNAIMEIKLDLAGINGQIRALEAVIGLPKAIMESGDRAKERMDDIG